MFRRKRCILYSMILLLMCFSACYIYTCTRNESTHREKPDGEKSEPKNKKRDHIDGPIHDGFKYHQFDRRTTAQYVAVSNYSEPKIRAVNIFEYQKLRTNSSKCVPFQTWRGIIQICIHDPRVDKMISAFINEYATWEQNYLNATGDILLKNPGMTFVDLGCNVGVYTLFAAKLGFKVLAVDILYENLELLQESLQKNDLTENVTLVHNAIANKREAVTLNVVKNNIGGSYVRSLEEGENVPINRKVQSILMDDLVPYVKSRDVFLKMDIEGTELKALDGAKIFFQTLNVRIIQMEWVLHRTQLSARKIINFMLRSGMMPYLDHKQEIPLHHGAHTYWPENIYWIKR